MQLNFKAYGDPDNEPLVILHGLLGSLDNWHTLASRLGRAYRVFTVDQRNHGRSPHADAFNYEVMSEDIVDWMEEQGLQEATLIGHSMGAKTAMQATLNHPERVSRLVSVDMAPFSYPSGHDRLFKALDDLDLDTISSRKEADEALAQWIDEFSIRQFLLKNLIHSNGRYTWKMNLQAIRRNYDRVLEPVTADAPSTHPALFIRAGRSGYIDQDALPDIREYFARARLETILDAGHWIHAEKPDAFLQTVERFLQEHPVAVS